MTAPTKLFLDYNTYGENWTILDSDRKTYGKGDSPEEAIMSARVVTDAPIYAHEDFKGIIDEVIDVPFRTPDELSEDDEIYGIDELIEVMADLGGFNVRKVYDEYHFLLGYTMDVME